MRKYLIRIESDGLTKKSECVTVYGDTPSRPFIIARNLWNYATPWTAARRLEMLARAWEGHGFQVRRFYGTVEDMPTRGNAHNVAMTLREWSTE
jgi:hypothetical protein